VRGGGLAPARVVPPRKPWPAMSSHVFLDRRLPRHCDEAIRLAPSHWLIAELTQSISVGTRRAFPLGSLQLIHQPCGLASRKDEMTALTLVGIHRFPAIETRVGPGVNRLHQLRQRGEHALQMPRNLSAAGSVSVVQFACDVFPGLGQKRQNRLITLLSFVLWVVALACSHLVAEQRVHRAIGVYRDR